MKIFRILQVIFEFLLEITLNFLQKHKKVILAFLSLVLLFVVTVLTVMLIISMIDADDSEIKKKYLIEHNLKVDVKCYSTNNGLRTGDFRLYKADEYRLENVVFNKWDIFPKNSDQNGFYLGKCDILKKGKK